MDQTNIVQLTAEIRAKYGSESLELMQQLVQAATDYELEIFKKSLERGFAPGDKLTSNDFNTSLAVYSTGIVDLLMRSISDQDSDVEQKFLDIFNEFQSKIEGGGGSDF